MTPRREACYLSPQVRGQQLHNAIQLSWLLTRRSATVHRSSGRLLIAAIVLYSGRIGMQVQLQRHHSRCAFHEKHCRQVCGPRSTPLNSRALVRCTLFRRHSPLPPRRCCSDRACALAVGEEENNTIVWALFALVATHSNVPPCSLGERNGLICQIEWDNIAIRNFIESQR